MGPECRQPHVGLVLHARDSRLIGTHPNRKLLLSELKDAPQFVRSLLLIVALALVATATTVPLVLAGMLVFGVGEGLVMPNIHFITTGVPASSRGSVVALYTSFKGIGQTAGPPVGSAVYASFGAPAAAWGGLAFCAVLLLPLLALPVSTGRPGRPTPEAAELA